MFHESVHKKNTYDLHRVINHSLVLVQGSHTSQMRKFKGISRGIKRSIAHFQGYFWKTDMTLLHINKISSNYSHLFQDLFWSLQHSKEVSIIFTQKNGWWQLTVCNLERKTNISVDLFFVSFTNFKGIQGVYTKFQAISRVQGAKINSRLFKGFKEPWEPCLVILTGA